MTEVEKMEQEKWEKIKNKNFLTTDSSLIDISETRVTFRNQGGIWRGSFDPETFKIEEETLIQIR